MDIFSLILDIFNSYDFIIRQRCGDKNINVNWNWRQLTLIQVTGIISADCAFKHTIEYCGINQLLSSVYSNWGKIILVIYPRGFIVKHWTLEWYEKKIKYLFPIFYSVEKLHKALIKIAFFEIGYNHPITHTVTKFRNWQILKFFSTLKEK